MRAVFSKTSMDQIKSRIKYPVLFELVLEVYGTPTQFAEIIEKYDQKEFEIEIKSLDLFCSICGADIPNG